MVLGPLGPRREALERVMKVLTITEAAEYLRVPRETLKTWRFQDTGLLNVGRPIEGPAWVRGRGGKCIGYLEMDLNEWLSRQRVAS